MPGFDGTGPKGEGPFSGRGEGHCAVKLPDKPGEPAVGYAGREGHPVGSSATQRAPEPLHPIWRRWWPAPGWRRPLFWQRRARGRCWGRGGRGRIR